LEALENYVAGIHGAGIKKVMVPEFNHEETPAPVHQARKLQINNNAWWRQGINIFLEVSPQQGCTLYKLFPMEPRERFACPMNMPISQHPAI
jgi:hypothetical protein